MKTKSIKKIFTIKSGTYPFDVLVGIGVSKKQLRNYIEKRFDLCEEEIKAIDFNEENGIQEARTIQLAGGQLVFWMKEFHMTSFHLGLLVHETHHMTQFLFDSIGLEYANESQEAWAYQHQYFFEQIMKKLIVKYD